MDPKTFAKFTAPSITVMLVMLVLPMLAAVWFGLHFMTFSNINDPDFIGLDNFRDVLSDPRFWEAFRWTIVIIAVTVPISMVLGLIMALLVDQLTGAVRSVFVAAYLLPMVIVPVIGSVVFRKLVEPSGIVAWAYRELFGETLVFDPTSMKVIILVNTVWLISPFSFIIFFAGLQTLPIEQSEAAAIDGTTHWQHVRYIIVPHLKSLIVLTALINVMDIFRLFDNVFVLTGQNPVYKSDTIMTYNYRTALDVKLLGLGNAMAVLTVVAIMVVLIPFLYITYREQTQER